MTLKQIEEEIAKLEAQKKKILDCEPTVCGIGYLGSDYDKTTDKLIYQRWNNILHRCYNPNTPNYKSYGGVGVTVSEEWFDFSNFKHWFLDNIWDCGTNETMMIDKDILSPTSKEYSPNNCLIIPVSFNSTFAGLAKEQDRKTTKSGAGGVNLLDNGRYQIMAFNTTFSNFISVENACETKINMYKALLEGMVKNYPNMPNKVKDAILNYDFYSAYK